MAWSFAMRVPLKVDVQDRALAREANDGMIENTYRLQIMNGSGREPQDQCLGWKGLADRTGQRDHRCWWRDRFLVAVVPGSIRQPPSWRDSDFLELLTSRIPPSRSLRDSSLDAVILSGRSSCEAPPRLQQLSRSTTPALVLRCIARATDLEARYALLKMFPPRLSARHSPHFCREKLNFAPV